MFTVRAHNNCARFGRLVDGFKSVGEIGNQVLVEKIIRWPVDLADGNKVVEDGYGYVAISRFHELLQGKKRVTQSPF